MLSILIPTYNYDCTDLLKQLVKQSLSSVLPIEIMVCDDASTHITQKKIVSEYCLRHNLTYIENNNNLGRTATRNKLAQKAQYNWLLFLDSDVLIENVNFVQGYIQLLQEQYPVISGGTTYSTTKPKGKELRWKYGVYREAKNAKQRMKNPHFIISQNLLIKKEVFLEINPLESRRYGLDNLFSYQLQHRNYTVLHSDNPIVHYGLEDNKVFLKKSIEAIETLIHFEKEKRMGEGFTSLQKSYLKLKRTKTKGLFIFIVSPFISIIKKNLIGSNPSLFLFDLYRLNKYIKLKSNA